MKGHKFDLNGDEWKLSSKMTIRPVTLRNILRPYPTLLEGAIRTLAWYAENKSGMTAEIIRHILGEMIEKFPPKLKPTTFSLLNADCGIKVGTDLLAVLPSPS